MEFENKQKDTSFYSDIKNDFSLYNRFYEWVKILATETGSLNKRLHYCYWNFLFAIGSNNFKEKELKEKLKYVEKIFQKKCVHFKNCNHSYLNCHWKESKKMAENIFYIYDYVIEIRSQNK